MHKPKEKISLSASKATAINNFSLNLSYRQVSSILMIDLQDLNSSITGPNA